MGVQARERLNYESFLNEAQFKLVLWCQVCPTVVHVREHVSGVVYVGGSN